MSTAINVICLDRPGMLRDIAGAVAKRGGNIVYTQQFVVERGLNHGKASVYMEIDCPEDDILGIIPSFIERKIRFLKSRALVSSIPIICNPSRGSPSNGIVTLLKYWLKKRKKDSFEMKLSDLKTFAPSFTSISLSLFTARYDR